MTIRRNWAQKCSTSPHFQSFEGENTIFTKEGFEICHVPWIGDDVGGLRRLQGGDLRKDEVWKSHKGFTDLCRLGSSFWDQFFVCRTFPRWWFQICLFSPLFGEVVQFDSYFSNGLKPPTSFGSSYHDPWSQTWFWDMPRYTEVDASFLLDTVKNPTLPMVPWNQSFMRALLVYLGKRFFFKFPLLKIYKNLIFCFCISWQVSGLGHEGTFIITYIYIYSYVCWWHCFPESFCCNNPSPIAWEGSLKNSAIDWGLLSGEFRTTYHENSNRMVPTFIGFSSCFNPTTGGCWKFNRPSISRVLHETPEAASIATEGRRRDLSVNEIPGCKFWTCAIFASMQIMNI